MIQESKKNPYSMNKNFPKWLTEQKKIWRNRKTVVNEQDQNRWSDVKSVLQIIPEKDPGNYTVWYYSVGKIQQMLLTIDRKYYVKDDGSKKAPR